MKSLEICSIAPEYTERPTACLCKGRPAGRAILTACKGPFAAEAAALNAQFLESDFPATVTTPTLILCSLEDDSIDIADRWLQRLPNGELAIVASGDYLRRFDAPAFRAIVRDVFW